jgi:hypothetical protein
MTYCDYYHYRYCPIKKKKKINKLFARRRGTLAGSCAHVCVYVRDGLAMTESSVPYTFCRSPADVHQMLSLPDPNSRRIARSRTAARPWSCFRGPRCDALKFAGRPSVRFAFLVLYHGRRFTQQRNFPRDPSDDWCARCVVARVSGLAVVRARDPENRSASTAFRFEPVQSRVPRKVSLRT